MSVLIRSAQLRKVLCKYGFARCHYSTDTDSVKQEHLNENALNKSVSNRVVLTDAQNNIIANIITHLENDFSLRNCLTEEIYNFLTKCQTVVKESGHSLSGNLDRNFKEVLEDNNYEIRLPSILSVLYCKAKGLPKKVEHWNEQNIWREQVFVGECASLGRAGNNLHKGLQTFRHNSLNTSVKNLSECNKQMTLGGDLLLSLSFQNICSLRNCTVLDLFSSVISNYSAEEFQWGVEGIEDKKLSYLIGKDQWEDRNNLFYSSSVENFTVAGLVLADHEDNAVNKAKEFGKYAGYTIQAYNNIKGFQNFNLEKGHTLDLLSLPAALHIKANSGILYYFLSCGNKREFLDDHYVWKSIRDSGSLEYAIATFKEYKNKTLNLLHELPQNESQHLLNNLIASYEC